MKKFILSLFVALLAGAAMAQSIGYTAIPPTIGDGVIDAMWNPIMPTAIRVQAVNAGTYAGQWRALYDDTHLYFLIEVKDNNPINNQTTEGNYYNGDGVEIMLSKADGTKQTQIGLGYVAGKSTKAYQSYGGVGKDPGDWYTVGNWYFTPSTTLGGTHTTPASTTGTLVADEVGTYSGYFLEFSIPFTELGVVLSPSSANQIKMELAINQSNDGNSRAAQMTTYHNSINHYKESYNYRTTALMPCTPLSSFPTDPVCNDGTFSLAANGTAVLTDRWWRKDGSGAWAELTSGAGLLTLTETNLPAGTYQYTYINGTGTSCRANITVGSAINFDDAPTYQCNAANALQLKASTVTGGTSPYTYYYAIDGSTTETAVTLAADRTFDIPKAIDNYKIIVEDIYGCRDISSIVTPSFPSVFAFDYQCNDETTLLLIETTPAAGGNGNYEYSLNGGAFQPVISDLSISPIASGSHTVKVKDPSTDCTVEFSKDFAKPQTPALNPSSDLELKAGDANVTLEATSPESAYQWNKNNELIAGETTATYIVDVNSSVGTTAKYSVKAQAANGCLSDPASINVTVKKTNLPSAINISEDGVSAGNNIFAAGAGTELYVFNRYGTTVYKEKVNNVSAMIGWNGCYDNKAGKEAEPGAYYYVLIVGSETVKGAIEVVK